MAPGHRYSAELNLLVLPVVKSEVKNLTCKLAVNWGAPWRLNRACAKQHPQEYWSPGLQWGGTAAAEGEATHKTQEAQEDRPKNPEPL